MIEIGTNNIYGNKWSQEVGREIFPILIQMAIDRQDPITYGELADEAEESWDRIQDNTSRTARTIYELSARVCLENTF